MSATNVNKKKRPLPRRIASFIFRHLPVSLRALILRVRAKMKNKRHIEKSGLRIMFFVTRIETWNSFESVFEELAKIPEAEITILVMPRWRADDDDPSRKSLHIEDQEIAYQTMKKYEGGNVAVVRDYDMEKGDYIDLNEPFAYIFINEPMTSIYPPNASIDKLFSLGKICYIPYYGFSASLSKFLVEFETPIGLLAYTDHWFSESVPFYKVIKKKARLISFFEHRKFIHCVGSARFDLYEGIEPRKEIKTILWNPRWTTPTQKKNAQSSFLILKDPFLRFVEESPDLDFIIRPHPLMFPNFVATGYLTQEEVDEYLAKIDSLPNVVLDQTSSYQDAIVRADLMLADFSSIVTEFAIQGKPVIYLTDPSELSDELDGFRQSFYCLSDWESIAERINGLRKGDDPNAPLREKAIKEFKERYPGHVGETIRDILLDDFSKNKKG